MTVRLASGTLTLGAQEAVSFAAAMALHIIASRSLGPSDYGVYSILLSMVTIIAMSTLLGLPHAVSRAVAGAGAIEQGLVRRAMGLQITIALVAALACVALADPLARLVGLPAAAPLLRIAALSLPLVAVSYVWFHMANGARAFDVQAIGQAGQTLLRLAATGLALAAGFGLTGAIVAMPVAAGLTLLLAVFLARRLRPVPGDTIGAPALLPDTLAFNGTFALVNLWLFVDVLLIGGLTGQASLAGLFGAASTLAAAPESLFAPLILAIFPILAAGEGSARTVLDGMWWAWVAFCPIIAGTAWMAQDLVVLFFGDPFAAAAPVLLLLVVAGVFRTLYYLGDAYLRAIGRRGAALRIVALALALNIGMGVVLIPAYGPVGAAIGSLVSAAVASGWMLYVVFRDAGASEVQPKGGVMTIILAGIAFLPFSIVPADGFWALILAIPCLGIYCAGLVAAGMLEPAMVQRSLGRWRQK